MNNSKQIFKQIKPILIVITYAIVLYFVFNRWSLISDTLDIVFSLFKPVIIGFCFAYVLNIPMKRIENIIISKTAEKSRIRRYKRPISMVITLILAAIIIILVLAFLVPEIVESLFAFVEGMGDMSVDLIDDCIHLLESLGVENETIMNQLYEWRALPWDEFVREILQWLTNFTGSAEDVTMNVYNQTTSFISEFATYFTGFMISLYFLAGKENLTMQLKKLLFAFCKASTAQKILNTLDKANYIYTNFIGGQLIEACILGGLFFIGLTILNMPYALLISVLITITALIPMFGAMLAMVIGFFLILPTSIWKAIEFVIFFQVLQQIENNLIYPRVVGTSVGLPGVYVLISIILFGNLFGVFGMLVAVPTVAFVYQVMSDIINNILAAKGIQLDRKDHKV